MKCSECKCLKDNKDAQYAKEYVCGKFGEGVATNEVNEEVVCKGFEQKL